MFSYVRLFVYVSFDSETNVCVHCTNLCEISSRAIQLLFSYGKVKGWSKISYKEKLEQHFCFSKRHIFHWKVKLSAVYTASNIWIGVWVSYLNFLFLLSKKKKTFHARPNWKIFYNKIKLAYKERWSRRKWKSFFKLNKNDFIKRQ